MHILVYNILDANSETEMTWLEYNVQYVLKTKDSILTINIKIFFKNFKTPDCIYIFVCFLKIHNQRVGLRNF